MAMTDARLTADEYFDVAADVPERTQLIDGVIVPSQPKWRHQRTAGLIHAHLLFWTRSKRGVGVAGFPIDVIVDEHNVYGPDIWWIAEPARLDPDEYYRGVPDIAVEVRSPSTWRYDIGVKKTRYQQHGLPELWLVDTAGRAVMVFRRSSPDAPEFDMSVELAIDDVLTSLLLPGFALPLVEIFGDD
jgi:Uma2 family endonuclease